MVESSIPLRFVGFTNQIQSVTLETAFGENRHDEVGFALDIAVNVVGEPLRKQLFDRRIRRGIGRVRAEVIA